MLFRLVTIVFKWETGFLNYFSRESPARIWNTYSSPSGVITKRAVVVVRVVCLF